MPAPSKKTSALIVALGVMLGAFLGLRSEPLRTGASARAELEVGAQE
jgi:hypothetical protein